MREEFLEYTGHSKYDVLYGGKVFNTYGTATEGLTIAECDEIAINNAGVIGALDDGYVKPESSEINNEYHAIVVDTKGLEGRGKLILRGTTPRARKLLRQGKVNFLVSSGGISRHIAEEAIRVARGMEVPVARLASQIVDKIRDETFDGVSHNEFKEWSGIQEYELSFPRILSAVDIAKRVVRKNPYMAGYYVVLGDFESWMHFVTHSSAELMVRTKGVGWRIVEPVDFIRK